MARLLEREGATVETLKHGVDFADDDASAADEVLREADILVLCHGAKGDEAMAANCDSFVALIERFKALRAPPLTPDRGLGGRLGDRGPSRLRRPGLEGVSPVQGRLRPPRPAILCRPDLIYRHIVPSAFRSAMGPGLISGGTAARAALFLIRRGFRYVPVT